MTRLITITALLVVCVGAFAGPAASAATFDDRLEAFGAATTSPTEADVAALLKMGVEAQRSAEALAAAQPWLNRNRLSAPASLYYAGRAAEAAGQWLAASGYYQNLLATDKPDPKLAGPAADATYRLLLNAIGDPNAAFLYARQHGDRIRGFGQARRYDRWFLDQAMQRRDLIAVNDRLATIARDNRTPLDAYQHDFEWLCRELENFRIEPSAVYEAAKRLAASPRVPALYVARLNWAATVIPYNQKLDELRNAKAPADPKLTDAPLAAAAQLIKVAPDRGPFIVANGWGVEYDGHHGTCAARFNVEGKRKLDQLLAAAAKMSADRRDDLLAHRLALGRVTFDPAAVRKIVIAHPGMLNALDVADVPLFDKSLTVEEAKQLAPQLARNPHAQAAWVRAFANPQRKYSVVVDQMMAGEAWRFADAKSMVHGIWHSGMFERDVDYQAPINKHQNFGKRYQQLKQQIAAKAASQQRLAAFNALRNDLRSASPKIPGSLTLWDELFANAPGTDTPAMLKALVTDTAGDRAQLLRRALGRARAGGAKYVYWEARLRDNYIQNGVQRSRYIKAMAPVVAELRRILPAQAKAGNISPALFGTWLHAVNPADEAARTLMQQLAASPAYGKLGGDYRAAAADGLHFGRLALTAKQKASDATGISGALLALKPDADAKTVEAALADAIKRAAAAPQPVTIVGVRSLASAPDWTDTTRKQVLSLFREHAPLGGYPTRQGYEELVQRVCNELRDAQRWGEIEPYLPGLWTAAAATDDARYYRGASALIAFAEAALKAEATSVALSVSRSGASSRADAGMKTRREPQVLEMVARLDRTQGRASIVLGIIDIPVDERDPAFPIYKSQAEFAMGNTDTAWQMYDKHADRMVPLVRKLTVPFNLWVLQRNLDTERTDRAEQLVRELTIWSRQATGAFTRRQEGELKIAYADAAFQKGALQTARAWYRRVADAAEYRNTPLGYDAILRSVRVDRAEKNYSAALTELDKLMLVRDDNLRMRVHFARAQVLYDQENYAEAFDEVSTVLKRDPDHADALILLGKAQLKMRKLVDASEIELGVSRDQELIVPGEAIKINLTDPALNISGVGADIEVDIWTKSGDRETVSLHQLGDDKTRFRAEVPTQLAARHAGDGVLQVLGRDEVRYGYSKEFRGKMTDLPPDPTVVIHVASDAHLAVSAGAFPPRAGERRLDLSELGVSTAQQALGTRRVRPGNPVYIRVTDPDQSKTDKVDEVVVSLDASSGDAIPRLVLTETGPHTGEFEATVPTARAQPLAYASETAPGHDPNMVISAENYPGWSGAVGSKATEQSLTIDLNDNVPLGTMRVECSDPAQAPTRFVVQTSMNGRAWVTRARYPDDPAPWQGKPQITAFATYGRNVIGVSTPEGRTVPEDWWQKMEIASARGGIAYGAFTVPMLGEMNLNLPSGGHPGYAVLMRYRAMFYQPAAAIRTFQLTGMPGKAPTLLLIDGRPADAESEDALTITRELKPGLHTIEVWRHESRGELLKRKPVLLQNVEGRDDPQPCPAEMFDPATFPDLIRATVPGPTTIAAVEGKPDQFDIRFGENTRGRLVRLVVVGHRGAAPSVHKITLTDRAGVQRLPVANDYQKLRSNSQLEVVPGDQVSVRYEDDRVVTPRRTISQGRLSVAYNTASISASFLTYITTEEGRELVLEPIRRFKLDDAVGIVIEDADMDQTADRDTLKFTVRSSSGGTAELEALETGPHTGVFLGRVFPVAGEPKRDSEVHVEPGGTLTGTYLDEENLDPGIPATRSVVIEHALFRQPDLAVYHVASKPLPGWPGEPDEDATDEDERGPEIVEARRSLHHTYLQGPAIADQPPHVTIGGTLRFDVLATHLAFAASSEVVAYVQTETGRKAYKDAGGASGDVPFDVRVPGTLKLTSATSRSAPTVAPAGYTIDDGAGPPTHRPALEEGRFAFSVPIVLGDNPSRSFATEAAASLRSSIVPDALAVRPGDRVHIGFAYLDPQGEPRWLTATVDLDSDAFLDVMNGRYRRDIHAAYVGEKLYVRLVDPAHDRTPDRDAVEVRLAARTGATVAYELRETDVHSGVFKGSFSLSYASKPAGGKLPPVALRGLPVRYGDTVTVSYDASPGDNPPARAVSVNKGADGTVEPFSKRYGEDAVAIKTTFTLAECFFELAKHHRKMDQESLARREMGHAQKLLAEAIESHRDPAMQAHAEYLLANLAQEYADLSKNDESKTKMYQDALARFSRIPLDYPETEFAPKAQFKKGLVYEKLHEVDIAVEEYVKLAYKYPDHELIPSVMSRLGAYFQAEGKAYKTQAEELEKKEGDAEAAGEAIRLRELATREYLNAAQVFKKLQERFPTDALAGLAGLRSAQNYMRAGDFKAAIAGFQGVIDTEQYDGRTIRSQAMFWSGISHERLDDYQEAYELYRRTTFDFPDSVWAKQARGRLADPAFARIIEMEELARERMLDALKNQK